MRSRALCSGHEVLMTENTMPANLVPRIEPTDPDQATQQTQQGHADLSDSQMQLGQPESLTKPAAPGRMPLFRR